MPPFTPNDRQRRILQLSQQWSIVLPPVPQPLSRPPQPPSFRTPTDDQVADDLLHRHALEASKSRPKSGLTRAFSSNNLKKNKTTDPREVLEVLQGWITNAGSPGVAEALIAKLTAVGVDLAGMQQQKGGLLNRKRSLEGFADRTQLLRSAVQSNQLDMARVLFPHADSIALDASLPIAIRSGNARMVEYLLRYGASTAHSTEGQVAFRHACSNNGLSEMIKIILQSEGRPPPQMVSESMYDAARAGCLDVVLHLSRSTADGNNNQAAALRAAVSMGRRDIAIAIIMGNQPPQRPGLDDAFRIVFEHTSLDLTTKLELAELLLCAGAGGEFISQALELSCESQFYDMANLLAMYGASVEYKDAAVLKNAIAKGHLELVNTLSSERSALSPALASSCVSFIPKQTTFEARHTLLTSLLRKGATGNALDESLIDATEAGDANSVELLLNPYFSSIQEPQTNGTQHAQKSRNGRHAVASVDHRDGEALRTAVLRSDIQLVQMLLAGRPSSETLTTVFPLTKQLSTADRYRMVELFLKRSLSGPCLHSALEHSLNEDVSQRDGSLVKLLLQHDADVNFNQGAGLGSLIRQKDIGLLSALLKKASPQTAAARIPDVMRVSEHRARYDMMKMLLQAGAAIGVKEMATGLVDTLSEKPVDMSLLRLLLQQGNADINALDGAVMKQAVVNPDPKVLELVFGLGKPTPELITQALHELAPLSSTESKAWKFKFILAQSNKKEDLNNILIHEVQSVARDSTERPSLATLELLLSSGADSNVHKAAALCHAVIAANIQVVDILFEAMLSPNPASLGFALPHALRVSDPMNRLTLTKKLVEAGASPREINRALIHAVGAYPDDLSLLSILSSKADTADGEALSLAVSKESADIMDILLTKSKHSTDNRNSALMRAMEIKNRATRNAICERLLSNGVSPLVASNALLIAARDGDVKLGDILMAHGANISSNNGQAIVEACRGGSVEVLNVLLKTDTTMHQKTLEHGFQAATEVRDLNKRAMIFEQLLRKGVKGGLVDTQLESAARYGEDGQGILRVLLVAGADPNHNSGEAVVAATRSAFVDNLELLLGLWDQGSSQKKVSAPTLIRAFKASWKLNRDSRFHIIKDLMKAGLPVADELHIALNDAVNEEDPEERLVKLLLEYGASPLANGCKTLVDAAEKAASSSLALLLNTEILEKDINLAFNQAFKASTFENWFTEPGLETAQMLLSRGAKGNALSEALVQVMKNSTTNTVDLADRFVEVLTAHGPDVNFDNGEPLRLAASRANVSWIHQLLACHPSTHTLTFAFHCIFDTAVTQDEVLELFQIFADYHEGDVRIDVMASRPGLEPVLVRALSQYPRSSTILTTLLDAGYYYDQATKYKIHPDIEEEEMTLLTWAIAQPQKRVSSSLIQLLLERGAKVNVETRISATTPLMLAVQTRRPDLVKMLLLEGADVDAMDYLGRTPLAMVTDLGGDVSIQMMSSLLAAEPAKDDGSLHNAARDLNLPAVRVLMESGHDPDFPSPLHNGRSALGEICLRGSDNGEMTPDRERKMQKVMAHLVDSGSDLSIKSNGKSMLHLCFDAADAVATTRALLKSGMWKHVNKSFNHFTDEKYVYSPTMYVTKLLRSSDLNEEILSVLRASRAADVFYAKEGPQPDDAVGLPADIETQERARKARDDRLVEESQDFALTLARKREIASVERQIQAQKVEMEDVRRRKLHAEDLASIRTRAQLEDTLANESLQRRLTEQRAVTEAQLGRTRAIAATELEAEESRQRKALEWESKMNIERTGNARALSEMRISEREELQRLDIAAEGRIQKRLEAQRKLVESQEKLAKRLADTPVGDPRRQIGYVTELN
ncbi:hypothetical protein PT974_09593 [Cladobotryum mycophilum]|uniref:Ankyrin repeat containing protein n=1 Tax=Cladobotryum mycophilum TaxID=491253 RepID=A0ABR0SGK0_9HYPO